MCQTLGAAMLRQDSIYCQLGLAAPGDPEQLVRMCSSSLPMKLKIYIKLRI